MSNKLDPVGKLFSDAWALFKERFGVAFAVIIGPIVLILAAQLILVASSSSSSSPSILGFVLGIVGYIWFIMAEIAIIFAVAQGLGFGDAYEKARGLFWPYLWFAILWGLVIMGGFVMLIVPGIILAVGTFLAVYVFALEGKRGLAAIAGSREYVRGYWWAVLGRFLLLGLCFIGGSIVFGIIFGIILGIAGSSNAAIQIFVVSAIDVFVIPFSVIFNYVLYQNLKKLKPEVAAQQEPIPGKKFLVVSGILGIVAPIVIFALAAFFAVKYAPNIQQMFLTPSATYLDPANGSVGTQVTIYGYNFATTGTIEFDNLVATQVESTTTDSEFTFTVPQTLAPNCAPDQACPQFLRTVTPDTYQVSVFTNGTTTNSMTFVVNN